MDYSGALEKVVMELTFKILRDKTCRQVCGRVLSFLVVFMRKQPSLFLSAYPEINTGNGGVIDK